MKHLVRAMNSGDYLDSSQEYETLYPQTVMDTDSQDSPHDVKRPPQYYSPSNAKHFDCFCGKIFISKADYNRHMLIHTGERPHECELCGKAFSLKGNLTKHMLLHTEEKPYHCPECGKSFLKKGYIDQHMRVHTGEKPFVCPHCHRAFSLKGNLAQHMKLHTDEKSFHCLECHKVFLKKSYLMQHMRVHAGDKPHKCSLCSRAFNLKGNLVQHMKRHSGRKPFKCTECDKAFALKSALKEHEKIHTGEKPFVCNVCSKAFNKKAYLTQHERIHTGEKPFMCIECNKAFTQRSILNQHMKQHGERSYKCCQCHKIFLKKLCDINKALRVNHFGGFKCEMCEELKEGASDDSLSGVFMKEEQMSGYDPQSYIPEDSSLYNMDDPQKSEDLEKLKLKIARMEGDFGIAASSTEKQNIAPSGSNGINERIYDYPTQSAMVQPTMVTSNSGERKFTDYSQKKVAHAHSISKENGKKSIDNVSKPDSSVNAQLDASGVAGASSEERKEAIYTELKVVEKDKLPSVNASLLEKNGLSFTPVMSVPVHQKQTISQREDKSKYSSPTNGDYGNQKMISDSPGKGSSADTLVKLSDKNRAYTKTASETSASVKSNGKGLDHLYKKNPSLLGSLIDSQQTEQSTSVEQSQRVEDVPDARRVFSQSQSSLSDLNARNMDRYMENLRDPYQRNLSSVRHGNGPEVESALSRFGIKGYYNSPWSFAGNYPE